jgi:hypothetical protein
VLTLADVTPALARGALSALAVGGGALTLFGLLPHASSRPTAALVVAVVGLAGLALHAGVLVATRGVRSFPGLRPARPEAVT